jgi:hypothetical protein
MKDYRISSGTLHGAENEKTISIHTDTNEHVVTMFAPISVAPEVKTVCYSVDQYSKQVDKLIWLDREYDNMLLKRGILHLSRENAESQLVFLETLFSEFS